MSHDTDPVQAALSALRDWKVKLDRPAARRLLDTWKHRHTLTDQQVTEVVNALTDPCPVWCQTDHPTADPQSVCIAPNGFTIINDRHHSHDVAKVPNPGCGRDKHVYVSVSLTTDLDTDRREGPHINVDGGELMTLATARVVAAAVHLACSIASDTRPAG